VITAIVFSRDRAMQLDLLLRSLPDELDPVYVICRPTTDEHEESYALLLGRDLGREDRDLQFLPDEGNLPAMCRELLPDTGLACFLTDDSVFYRRPGLQTIPWLVDEELCHSFRLGLNTTYCYPLYATQELPHRHEYNGEFNWRWADAEGDFGYPGSLDGHVFRTSHLRRCLMTCRADANPNQIEEHLNRWVKARLGTQYPLMVAEMESSLVSIPANRVNVTHPNRNGDTYTPEELCARYLDGQRLDLDEMDFLDVHGAHQEIPLVFR
jgi:hypothetical protein